ncbi:gpW family head-tail joining protein [Pseudoalteromonas tetraodonis]|uniref:gpW family head-tail joining protein n=1 Tax=Pseudoalteromonas tetraodonis TaxID=43659 RepID=UPI00300113F2
MTEEQRLAEMKTAYSNLLMGKSVRVMQKDGRRVEFSPANINKLKSAITELENALGSSNRRGPAGVF